MGEDITAGPRHEDIILLPVRTIAGTGENKAVIISVRLFSTPGKNLATNGSRNNGKNGRPGSGLDNGKCNQHVIAESADDGNRPHPFPGRR